jgi:hypothetical protein
VPSVWSALKEEEDDDDDDDGAIRRLLFCESDAILYANKHLTPIFQQLV